MKIKLGSAIVAALSVASCFGANLDQSAALAALVVALLDLGTRHSSDREERGGA